MGRAPLCWLSLAQHSLTPPSQSPRVVRCLGRCWIPRHAPWCEEFYDEGGETLAHITQRSGRCPIPGNIQGQVDGVWVTHSSWRCPCSLQGSWTRWPLKVPSSPNYSIILCIEQLGLLLGKWWDSMGQRPRAAGRGSWRPPLCAKSWLLYVRWPMWILM